MKVKIAVKKAYWYMCHYLSYLLNYVCIILKYRFVSLLHICCPNYKKLSDSLIQFTNSHSLWHSTAFIPDNVILRHINIYIVFSGVLKCGSSYKNDVAISKGAKCLYLVLLPFVVTLSSSLGETPLWIFFRLQDSDQQCCFLNNCVCDSFGKTSDYYF